MYSREENAILKKRIDELEISLVASKMGGPHKKPTHPPGNSSNVLPTKVNNPAKSKKATYTKMAAAAPSKSIEKNAKQSSKQRGSHVDRPAPI